MKVLIACEFSGIVRDAFTRHGHDSWSCDLLPSERPGQHIEGDVLPLLNDPWDLIIAHPPCTYLAVSGARWWKDRVIEQRLALDFCLQLMSANTPRLCLENPIGYLSTAWRKPDQIIQPWMFGHGETKATCLWLRGLRPLRATNMVKGRRARVHHEPPGPNQWKNRSRTLPGIAEAMATQFGTALATEWIESGNEFLLDTPGSA